MMGKQDKGNPTTNNSTLQSKDKKIRHEIPNLQRIQGAEKISMSKAKSERQLGEHLTE